MKNRYTVSLAVAASFAMSIAFAPEVVAQTRAPGTKQMQDTQRKAEQKALGTGKKSHHKDPPRKARLKRLGAPGRLPRPSFPGCHLAQPNCSEHLRELRPA